MSKRIAFLVFVLGVMHAGLVVTTIAAWPGPERPPNWPYSPLLIEGLVGIVAALGCAIYIFATEER